MTVSANPTYTQPYAVSDVVAWEEGAAKYSRLAPDYDGSITGSFTVYNTAEALPIGTVLEWSVAGYVVPTMYSGYAWAAPSVTAAIYPPTLIILVEALPIASATQQVTAVAGHAVLKLDKLYFGAAMTAATGTYDDNVIDVCNELAKQGIVVSETA
jgi:hypothetical protein